MKIKRFAQTNLFLALAAFYLAGCTALESAQVQIPATESTSTVVPSMVSPTVTRLPTTTFAPTQTPTATVELELVSLPGVYDLLNETDQARLVLIPGDTFEMGIEVEEGMAVCDVLEIACDPSDFADETPKHRVGLDPYYIYQFEVTNAQYKLCVEEGDCSLPAFGEFYNDERFSQHPVVYVSWFDASDYCAWAGGRLPTEAEWEFADRGTDGRTFPWGNTPDCGFGNYSGCTQGLTAAIGSFPAGASPFGVYDMAGNVTEWVGDWYAPKYYGQSPEINPTGPEDGEMRTARGGSWKNPLLGMRTTDRTANFPEVYSTGTGFRCMIPMDN